MLTSLFCLFVVTEETKFCGFLKRHALRCVCACACAREKPIKVWTNQIEVTKKKLFRTEGDTLFRSFFSQQNEKKRESNYRLLTRSILCYKRCSTVFENHRKSLTFNIASEASKGYILSWQKFIKNGKIKKFKCDILSDFQTFLIFFQHIE